MRANFNGVVSEITTLPGSSQVAVSHNLFLLKELRGQGLGNEAMRARLTYIFCDLQYDMVVCTVENTNGPERKLLTKHGWKLCDSFKSRKTDHVVEMWSLTFQAWVADINRNFTV